MSISVTSPCTESIVEQLGINIWRICTSKASFLDWTFDDKETCLILEGEVTETPYEGEPV